MRETLDYIAETHRTRQIGTIGAILALCAFGGLIGYHWPDLGAARSYDLVQITGEESDVIDFNQSATDCGFKLLELERAGLTGFCEVAR